MALASWLQRSVVDVTPNRYCITSWRALVCMSSSRFGNDLDSRDTTLLTCFSVAAGSAELRLEWGPSGPSNHWALVRHTLRMASASSGRATLDLSPLPLAALGAGVGALGAGT